MLFCYDIHMQFTMLDFILAVATFSASLRGFAVGFIRQVCSVLGFLAGLYLGVRLAPHLITYSSNLFGRTAIALTTVLMSGVAVGAIGDVVGVRMWRAAGRLHVAWLDSLLGAATGAAMTLVTYWLVAPLLLALPVLGAGQAAEQSQILSKLNQVLPPPASVYDRFNSLVAYSGFPKVFNGLAPRPAPSVATPSPGAFTAVAATSSPSVLKIAGTGCGGISLGTGFVVGNNLVATNAHVIAGVRQTTVRDAAGRWHKATPVFFDANEDIALLRTTGITAPVLGFTSADVGRGAGGVVIGYPGGGDEQVVPGAVLQRLKATGQNLYNQREVTRDVYEIQAEIQPGNSGGPMISADGKVFAVIFAKSTTVEGVGYALSSSEVGPELNAAAGATKAVSTGACVAD